MSFWYLGRNCLDILYSHWCHFDVLYVTNMPNYNGREEEEQKEKNYDFSSTDCLLGAFGAQKFRALPAN